MQTYHTVVKDLIRYKKCPKRILKLIPRTNIYRWEQESDEKYIHFSIKGFDTVAQSYCVMPGLLFSIGRLILLLNKIRINAETSIDILEKTLQLTPLRRSKLTPSRRSKLTPYCWGKLTP